MTDRLTTDYCNPRACVLRVNNGTVATQQRKGLRGGGMVAGGVVGGVVGKVVGVVVGGFVGVVVGGVVGGAERKELANFAGGCS